MQSRINFNEVSAEQSLIALRMLLKTSEAVRIGQASGNGSGDTADDLAALYGTACAIRDSLNRLIESTILFVENCAGQMRKADRDAAAELS
ncbi:MAG: hypothetical protein LIO75_05380 [Lachnospiraceae bacterium]|nr:hypothetical protein [Lachnospiraceae bacterium]